MSRMELRDALRGRIRIRTADDPSPRWTASGDLVPGRPYSYISGDVVVLVDWDASIPAEPEQADEDRCDDRYQHHPGAPWQRCTGPAFHDGGHISGLPEPEQADEVAGLDVEDCPKCGEWRDGPTADCAACGFAPASDDTP